jgi:hypothetical protein
LTPAQVRLGQGVDRHLLGLLALALVQTFPHLQVGQGVSGSRLIAPNELSLAQVIPDGFGVAYMTGYDGALRLFAFNSRALKVHYDKFSQVMSLPSPVSARTT